MEDRGVRTAVTQPQKGPAKKVTPRVKRVSMNIGKPKNRKKR
jgi:hypothetical protein